MIAAPVATPAVAGRQMTVRFRVTRSDTGELLTAGRLICDPSVAGKAIAHAEQFKSGVVQLRFVVPRSAKGKLLTVHVTIRTTAGQSGTRISAFHVR